MAVILGYLISFGKEEGVGTIQLQTPSSGMLLTGVPAAFSPGYFVTKLSQPVDILIAQTKGMRFKTP